jgi:hypothetical protein
MSTNTPHKTVWILLCAVLIIVISYLALPSLNTDKNDSTSEFENALSASKSTPSFIGTQSADKQAHQRLAEQSDTHNLITMEAEAYQEDFENNGLEDLNEVLPRVLSSYTQAGALLDDYLEAQDIAYLDSSFYPFDAQTDSIVRQYANSGKILLFDNTQATENLLEFNKSSGDVVSDYYGTGAESSMTIATSVKLANGGIEYMVLPISKSENDNDIDLSEKVKLAIELFQLEQTKKRDDQANG